MTLCSNQTVRLCWSSAGSTHETRQRLTVFLFISVKQNYSQTISWGLLLLIFRLLLLQHVMNLCKNSPEVKTACFSLVFHRELNEIAFIKVVTVWSEQRLVLACGAGGGCDFTRSRHSQQHQMILHFTNPPWNRHYILLVIRLDSRRGELELLSILSI